MFRLRQNTLRELDVQHVSSIRSWPSHRGSAYGLTPKRRLTTRDSVGAIRPDRMRTVYQELY